MGLEPSPASDKGRSEAMHPRNVPGTKPYPWCDIWRHCPNPTALRDPIRKYGELGQDVLLSLQHADVEATHTYTDIHTEKDRERGGVVPGLHSPLWLLA